MHFYSSCYKLFVSLSVDNYLAMEVACTLLCPKDNQEVIVTHPDGTETQKCEKCEGDCPKGSETICLCGCFMCGGGAFAFLDSNSKPHFQVSVLIWVVSISCNGFNFCKSKNTLQ